MRRLWDTCKRYPKSHYRIHLSEDALLDIKWWHCLLSDWNGKSFFLSSRWTPAPDIQLFTDASGTIGWARVTATGGCRTSGPHIRQLTTSYGRSCTPLPLQAPPGGTNSKGCAYLSTLIMRQWWPVLPAAPIVHTSSCHYYRTCFIYALSLALFSSPNIFQV